MIPAGIPCKTEAERACILLVDNDAAFADGDFVGFRKT